VLKELAEFVMRGRLQAQAVAMLGALSIFFCWVSAAVVALVALRKGPAAALWVYLWAMLPAGVLVVVFGDTGPVTLLTSSLVLALVLRASVSLPVTLLASVAVGFVVGFVLMTLGEASLELIAAEFEKFLAALEEQWAQNGTEVELTRPVPVQIAGMLAAGTASLSVLCLLLARYWQATLYNPGGFGEEFRALYYPAALTSALVLAALAIASMGTQYRAWAILCFIPLSFAGLALVHARVKWRGKSAGWLGWFYVAWVVLDPIKLVVVFMAIADSWLNFRARWVTKGGAEKDEKDDPS